MGLVELPGFSRRCLEIIIARFPEFQPYVEYPQSDYFIWLSELPWPSGAIDPRVRIATCHDFGIEFRLDIGNTTSKYGDYGKTGSFEFLEAPLKMIDDFLREKLVLVKYWYKPAETVDKIMGAGFRPRKSALLKYLKVSAVSWNGSFDRSWEKTEG